MSIETYQQDRSPRLKEAFRISYAGQIGLMGPNYGTAGQVLTSQGPSSPVQWAAAPTPYEPIPLKTKPEPDPTPLAVSKPGTTSAKSERSYI